MAFESLSHQFKIVFDDFSIQWLPLTHLYDPDLPLFPLLYFHAIDPKFGIGMRPGPNDRIFGFVQHVNFEGDGKLAATVVTNKNLFDPSNARFVPVLHSEVSHRLGLADPVRELHISTPLMGGLASATPVMIELWHSIVVPAFGGKLPFGRMWDEVLGLVRYIASWNSDGGRKGELIQTHYFASAFGEKIATAAGIHADFYLLPTIAEFKDLTNPLGLYPAFRDLVLEAEHFVSTFCAELTVGGMRFSAFDRLKAGMKGRLDSGQIITLMNMRYGAGRRALYENFGAFNRGPHRSIIALMMIDDLRRSRWDPARLTPAICADMYEKLSGSYQSPKVIQLYAQQCFASEAVLPIDTWIQTFLESPMNFSTKGRFHHRLFASSHQWGRLERLIWVAAQARKVHSSVAADLLWCIRYGGPDKQIRGANPLSCKICNVQIRNSCPSFKSIERVNVHFNVNGSGFVINTSLANNTSGNQSFVSVKGDGIYDEYSTRDRPSAFGPFPRTGHNGDDISVKEFLDLY